MVVNVWCKTCRENGDQIRMDVRVWRKVLNDIKKYIEGTDFVSKHTVTRHLESNTHRIGLELSSTVINQTTATAVTDSDCTITPKAQPRINDALAKQATDAYRKLIK